MTGNRLGFVGRVRRYLSFRRCGFTHRQACNIDFFEQSNTFARVEGGTIIGPNYVMEWSGIKPLGYARTDAEAATLLLNSKL